MATFHPFPRLPTELRLRIWEMTVEPRIVEIRCREFYTYGRGAEWILHSSTPIPAPLQTCRESRNARLYQRCFSDLAILLNSLEDLEQRYVWLNLDIDTVSIGDTFFSIFKPIAHMIKRLRFERDNTEEWWCVGTGNEDLRYFMNASEIQVVVCEDGYMEDWHGSSSFYHWPCGTENVLVIDPKEGEEMKLMDLEVKYDRIAEEESRQDGTDYLYHHGVIIN